VHFQLDKYQHQPYDAKLFCEVYSMDAIYCFGASKTVQYFKTTDESKLLEEYMNYGLDNLYFCDNKVQGTIP